MRVPFIRANPHHQAIRPGRQLYCCESCVVQYDSAEQMPRKRSLFGRCGRDRRKQPRRASETPKRFWGLGTDFDQAGSTVKVTAGAPG